ncbi:MAG: 4Fe-4S binding protein [Desulfobacterales bacterium]
MNEDVYRKLARVLDTLPNGFPSTENGAEMKLLKKIFDPDEADLFCDLKLTFETAQEISERTGRPLETLEEKLIRMRERGQVMSVALGGTRLFKMVPWAFGLYELQLNRLDREFAELNEEFAPVYGKQFFGNPPQMMQTLPIEEELSMLQEALPYQKITKLLESNESFMVMECICKKEQGILGKPCTRPLEVCMAMAPIPKMFDNHPTGRAVSREEARALLKKTEELGLVHLTSNFKNGHFFICNCCGCCCGVLSSINKLGIPAWTVVNSDYYAAIDSDLCTACGTCADERCQINAIEEGDEAYSVIPEKCIGCGLCITTCPVEAIRLVRKDEKDIQTPPDDEISWYRERAWMRGVDIAPYA